MRAELEAEVDEGAEPEHSEEYRAKEAFWVPHGDRWEKLRSQAASR